MSLIQKKILVPLIVIVMSALMLSGCHGAKETAAFKVPESFDENKKIEITFWAKNDTNKNQTDVYHKAIEDFHDLYPNVTVNLRLYTDYGRIYNDVITNISTGTTPNVCITYPDHIATYLTGDNQVVALDDLIADERYGLGGVEVKFDAPSAEEMIPEYMDECRLLGLTYALPYMRSTEVCYINKDYVEALGYEVPDILTWDYIWEVSEAAMARNSDGTFVLNGDTTMIPFIYKSTDNMMISMLKQKDAGYSTSTGDIEIFNDTTTELLEEISTHAKSGAFSTFQISSYPANFLNAGQSVFAIDSTAGSTWMGSDAPLIDIDETSLTRFTTVVRPIPQFDTSDIKMISQGPSVCIFNKSDDQEVMASWLFAQYLMSNNVQIPYAKTEGYVPVTLKAQQSAEYMDYLSRSGEDNKEHYNIKIEATQTLIDNIDNTFVTPVFNGSTSLRGAAGALVEDVVKAVRRKKTVDDSYIQKLYADTTSLYHLDQISTGGVLVAGESDLGPLPAGAVALLVTIASIWVLIGVYLVYHKIKKMSN